MTKKGLTIKEKVESINRRKAIISNLLITYFEERRKMDNRQTGKVAQVTEKYASMITDHASQ